MLKHTPVQPGRLSVPSLNGQIQSGHHLWNDVVIVDAQLVSINPVHLLSAGGVTTMMDSQNVVASADQIVGCHPAVLESKHEVNLKRMCAGLD